jgi:hypothetical protein
MTASAINHRPREEVRNDLTGPCRKFAGTLIPAMRFGTCLAMRFGTLTLSIMFASFLLAREKVDCVKKSDL